MKPKFRCSGIGHLMTEPKLKADKDAGNLSEGAKTHAIDVWVSEKFSRREEIYSKYIDKGNAVEDDSITFLSLLKKRFFIKNEVRLENDFITGTPDLFIGENIVRATEIVDIKSSWDVFTFHRSKFKPTPNAQYFWQMQGYMWLTGATSATIAYCLVNATADLINDERRKLGYGMRVDFDDPSPEYIKACQMVERNMIYDLPLFRKNNPTFALFSNEDEWQYDVPASERIHEVIIPRSEYDIDRIKDRVEAAWRYLESIG